MSSSENILYELLNTVEWIVPQTSEEIIGSGVGKPPVPVVSKVLGVAQRLLSLVSPLASKLTSQISDVLGCQSTWKVSYCSAGGGVVAVLQEAALEIRHAKHHFQDVIGYTDAVHPDAYPQWRRVAWAASGSVVAVSFSDGVVQLFSTLAQHLYTIYPPRYTEGAMHSEPQRAIAALSINEEKLQGPKWLCEVLCVEYNGSVRSYLVSAAEGYQTYATFSLAPYYPHGITAATLHSSLLVVAGATPYMSDPSLNYYGVGHGITLWRRLEQYPHLKQVSVCKCAA
ncbi:Neuroblastoma-amplified sequence N-terminal [Trinorchestia longiramus]|nr:Neuroblastoma-amplified sequence N-terminal [Trinorchestia longiramus]